MQNETGFQIVFYNSNFFFFFLLKTHKTATKYLVFTYLYPTSISFFIITIFQPINMYKVYKNMFIVNKHHSQKISRYGGINIYFVHAVSGFNLNEMTLTHVETDYRDTYCWNWNWNWLQGYILLKLKSITGIHIVEIDTKIDYRDTYWNWNWNWLQRYILLKLKLKLTTEIYIETNWLQRYILKLKLKLIQEIHIETETETDYRDTYCLNWYWLQGYILDHQWIAALGHENHSSKYDQELYPYCWQVRNVVVVVVVVVAIRVKSGLI